MLQMIPIQSIGISPENPRKENFEAESDWPEMVESIRRHGVLCPILVRETEGEYELLAGQRRLTAATEAGLDEIPAHVIEADDTEAAIVGLVENIQRRELSPLDEACAMDDLCHAGLTAPEIAKRMDRSVAYVRRRIRLASLSERWVKRLELLDAPIEVWERIAGLSLQHSSTVYEAIPDAVLREGSLVARWLSAQHRRVSEAAFNIEFCLECQQLVHDDLFETVGTARCGNPECWEHRHAEMLRQRLAEEAATLLIGDPVAEMDAVRPYLVRDDEAGFPVIDSATGAMRRVQYLAYETPAKTPVQKERELQENTESVVDCAEKLRTTAEKLLAGGTVSLRQATAIRRATDALWRLVDGK